jgi:hypothetical protein
MVRLREKASLRWIDGEAWGRAGQDLGGDLGDVVGDGDGEV